MLWSDKGPIEFSREVTNFNRVVIVQAGRLVEQLATMRNTRIGSKIRPSYYQ